MLDEERGAGVASHPHRQGRRAGLLEDAHVRALERQENGAPIDDVDLSLGYRSRQDDSPG
jgi:hypothetical protein